MEIGTIIHKVRSCPSTNDLAEQLALAGELEGTVIIAEEQTKGRGTKGRSWYSVHGKGLYLSVILRPEGPDISLLPLVAGLAAKEAVMSATGLDIRLKWPNDLICEKKKLGGILCESNFLGNRVNYVIVGIGMNLDHEPDDFPEEIRFFVSSLKIMTKRSADRDLLFSCLWRALNYWYGLFREGKNDEIVRAFEESMAVVKGKKIIILRDESQISGFYAGIDSQGGLILEVGGERIHFYSGEILTIEYE